jgi:YggT family protein
LTEAGARREAGLAGEARNGYMSARSKLETSMIAVINTLLFIISIAWFLVIASAIFSWLYAFNVINANNQVIATIGRSLYQLTEPVYRPIRRILPNFGGVDLSPLVVLVILFFLEQVIRSVLAPAVL